MTRTGAQDGALRHGRRDLRDLPKAHLHVHLDGGYPPEAVQALAARHGRTFAVPGAFPDVWAFFDAYGSVPALVESHEDLAGLCRALVVAEAAEGVVYLEPAVEPQLYAPRLGSMEQVLTTVLRALAEAGRDTGIAVGANLTINTDEDEGIALEIARLAAAHAGAGVTALGTAGFVEPAGLVRFRDAAGIARAAGLPVVSHAGQTGGPDSVREALDALGATRLSHGFRAIEDPSLVARLADEGIVCDVCPVSNVALGVVPTLADHPAPRLAAEGVPITLNADDPLWFGATVTDQYRLAREAWHLSDADLAEFARTGARVSAVDDRTRHEFLSGIDAWLTEGRME